ncbi:hypothetical protein [Bradyrhizobium lablabi]|nr:hypothetical protein [Bradyrhizobium lablabi]
MRKVVIITLATVFAVLAAQTASRAAPTFDGLWATSRKDCRDKDGPDSKTFIDLDNVIKDKPAPLVDQYENHCRVDRKAPADDGMVLSTTCFEFWDDYNKGANGRKVTISFRRGQSTRSGSTASPTCFASARAISPRTGNHQGSACSLSPDRRQLFKFARRPHRRSVFPI